MESSIDINDALKVWQSWESFTVYQYNQIVEIDAHPSLTLEEIKHSKTEKSAPARVARGPMADDHKSGGAKAPPGGSTTF
jgi:hypothetical protein